LRLPLLAHAEDPIRLRPLPASTRRYADWLSSRPPEAEVSAIKLLGRLANEFGAHVHIVHVASKEGVDAVQGFGGRLTAETCPHYLTFAAEEIPAGGTAFKCAPPIRDGRERAALRRQVGGVLTIVASDHSPAPPGTKDLEGGDFAKAWGGIASLEVSLAAAWSALNDVPNASRVVVAAMASEPARLAGLEARKGAIAVGRDADLVAFDTEASWIVDPAQLHQRHPVTPYAGRTLRGRVQATWLRGEPVYRAGEIVGEPRGLWQRRGRAGAVDPANAFA
jgi:allantoinase